MSRSSLVLAVGASLLFGACSNGEVAVTVALEMPDPEQEGATRVQALGDVEVALLPFDRDVVFDSLAAAANTPEPEIPSDVLEAQDSIADAQERWQNLETRWATLRDTLQTITEIMGNYSRAESRYAELFRLHGDMEEEYARVDDQKDRAFARFDSIQRANIAREQEIRIQRENWAADAFADVDAVFLEKIRAAGREVVVDTTDVSEAGGTVRFTGLKSGTWWINARYELPFTELYWNVPVEVGGEPTVVELSRTNAEERPKL